MRPVVSPVLGRVFRAVFGAILLVRRPKPIHAHGVVLRGRVTWRVRPPARSASGLAWVDEAPPRPLEVVGRVSRSLGLPPPLPDVVGLALRVDGPAGPADLELASTGFGVPSRFWLAPQRSPSRARLGTLFPYRGTAGPVLLCARTVSPSDLPVGLDDLAARLDREPWRLTLYWATPTSRWHPFADVELARADGPRDAPLRFDAVEHPLPGVATYAWAAAVRQPSYRLARRARAGSEALQQHRDILVDADRPLR